MGGYREKLPNSHTQATFDYDQILYRSHSWCLHDSMTCKPFIKNFCPQKKKRLNYNSFLICQRCTHVHVWRNSLVSFFGLAYSAYVHAHALLSTHLPTKCTWQNGNVKRVDGQRKTTKSSVLINSCYSDSTSINTTTGLRGKWLLTDWSLPRQ